MVFDRPFANTATMDWTLMEAWRERVGANDTIVCVGDVSAEGYMHVGHAEMWSSAPGRKWLVLGNHDVDLVNRIRSLETERSTAVVIAPGGPAARADARAAGRGAAGVRQHARPHPREAVADQPPHQRERRAARLRAGQDDPRSAGSLAGSLNDARSRTVRPSKGCRSSRRRCPEERRRGASEESEGTMVPMHETTRLGRLLDSVASGKIALESSHPGWNAEATARLLQSIAAGLPIGMIAIADSFADGASNGRGAVTHSRGRPSVWDHPPVVRLACR